MEKPKKPPTVINAIPKEISENSTLNAEIAARLPPQYNFEIYKTLWRIQEEQKKLALKSRPFQVALQLPEGLQQFAPIISDILSFYGKCECVILGEVTYGACCLQDYLCEAFGVDLIVHYAHSCIIPLNKSPLKTLYVFVEIQFDLAHFVETIKHNFQPSQKLVSRISPPIDCT